MNGAVVVVDDAKEISYNSSGTNYQHVRVRTSTERTWSGVDAAFRRRRRRPSKFSGCPSVFPALHARLVHNRPPSRKRIRNREETLVRVGRRPLARALPLGGVNHFPLSHRTATRPLLAARPSTPVPLFSGRMMATAEGNRGTSEEGGRGIDLRFSPHNGRRPSSSGHVASARRGDESAIRQVTRRLSSPAIYLRAGSPISLDPVRTEEMSLGT